MRYSIKQINEAVNGKLVQGDDSIKISGVSIDSRTVKKDQLFVAIKGLDHDGHKYINDVLKKGAAGIVISKRVSLHKNIPVILVKDTTKAFGQIAAFHRQQFNVPVIAVTGSVGKTTTKEMIAAVLESKYRVLKNFKTQNNQYGVPLTLLKLKKSHDIVVLELGTNMPGDIAWLQDISRPTIAVFTAIGEAHLELLGSKAGVFKEKLNLIKNIGKDGHIIFNSDDEYLKKIKDIKTKAKKHAYSIIANSGLKAKDIEIKADGAISFKVKNKKYTICCLAMHNVYNALVAISCGQIFNINPNNINIYLKKTNFCQGRQEVLTAGSVTIIDDSYNSNPVSFASAIKTLAGIKTKGRRICVCGDMRELGKNSKSLHEKVGKLLADANIDIVLSFGQFSRNTVMAVRKANKYIIAEHFQDFGRLNAIVKDIVNDNDVVLVKGSRRMKMERAIEFLKKNF